LAANLVGVPVDPRQPSRQLEPSEDCSESNGAVSKASPRRIPVGAQGKSGLLRPLPGEARRDQPHHRTAAVFRGWHEM